MLYQIYNCLTFGPMALALGDYKSDIALISVLHTTELRGIYAYIKLLN